VASPHSSSLQCPRMITPSVEPEGRRGEEGRQGKERRGEREEGREGEGRREGEERKEREVRRVGGLVRGFECASDEEREREFE
jgi:hypothetical protein